MSDRVQHPGGGKSLTRQSEAAATDINRIMDKYVKTGKVPGAGEEPLYGDFTSGVDFHTAMSRVRQAEEEFLNLPPHVRDFCKNDPGTFLDLVMDAAGRAQLEELGMVSDFAPPSAPDPEPGVAPGPVAPAESPPDPSATEG